MLSAPLLLKTANIIPSLPSSGLRAVMAFYYQESLLDFLNPGMTNYYIPSVTCPSPDKQLIFIQSPIILFYVQLQFSSVTQSYPTIRDPMDHSMPGLPVHHQLRSLLKLISIESVMPSNHLILCRPLLTGLQSFPASGSFQMSQFFASSGQSFGVSASASLLPMNIQD